MPNNEHCDDGAGGNEEAVIDRQDLIDLLGDHSLLKIPIGLVGCSAWTMWRSSAGKSESINSGHRV